MGCAVLHAQILPVPARLCIDDLTKTVTPDPVQCGIKTSPGNGWIIEVLVRCRIYIWLLSTVTVLSVVLSVLSLVSYLRTQIFLPHR